MVGGLPVLGLGFCRRLMLQTYITYWAHSNAKTEQLTASGLAGKQFTHMMLIRNVGQATQT